MRLTKRKIPRVALVSLVAGVGCDDSSWEGLAQTYCRGYLGCEPDDFAYEYASLAECEDAVATELELLYDYYGAAYGVECARSVLDLYACLFESAGPPSCTDAFVETDCADELFAYFDACD